MLILTFLLFRFTQRLGANVTKLRTFANRADHNESLETEDLIEFPNDELGEIAEKIIKIYKRLQHTKKEQDILKRQLT
ncbi:MAG: histidine kinase, partial [Prevotella pectinovora]